MNPIVLTTVMTEAEAAILVAQLEDHGIAAQISGGLTGGFRAEAPGSVRVLVHEENMERAKALLAERDGGGDGGGEDADQATGDEEPPA